MGGVVEVGEPPPDLGRFVFADKHSEAFFHAPGGADLFGRICVVEHPPEPGPLLR